MLEVSVVGQSSYSSTVAGHDVLESEATGYGRPIVKDGIMIMAVVR